jgi:protein-S-isoprenylcysteine O-methyltransferase Ste14
MRSSFRIGVDDAEQTELITDGPFAVVRNPIYSAMLPAVLGLVLLTGNAGGIAGFALLVVALELQTRLVEEPYLLRVHGQAYASYAARVGRFLPGAGRLARG